MRLRITIKEDVREKLEREPNAMRAAFRDWSRQAAQVVRAAMVNYIRENQQSYGRTGTLSNSVTTESDDKGFRVYPTVDYAVFVDQPTRPHEIRPVRAQALAFPMPGGRLATTRGGQHLTAYRAGSRELMTDVRFARVVHHPGTRGMFFIQGTVEETEETIVDLLEDRIEAALKELGL